MTLRPFDSLGLRFDGARLELLDQRLLPDQTVWVDADDPDAMVACIRALSVRGAPLIGVAAAVCLGHYALRGAEPDDVRGAAARLRAARPTAVNLMHAVDRMMARWHPDDREVFAATAQTIFDEDVALCDAMAEHGAGLLDDGGVITHCNTGGLATVGVGTALGVIRRAWERGRKLHVYVDETRPLLQGGRLTAWELGRLGIPYTLITDSMAALVMRAGKARRVLVGADRVAMNGDFANKVGTYALSVVARHHGVPFHPVAPYTTVDPACDTGDGIPIEDRDGAEVRGFGALRWAPAGCHAMNPSFDVTPAANVTSLVLDRGVFSQRALADGALRALGLGGAARHP